MVAAAAPRADTRAAALETALAFWRLLMPYSPTWGPESFTERQLDMWEKFLTTQTGGRAISRDTWTLVSAGRAASR